MALCFYEKITLSLRNTGIPTNTKEVNESQAIQLVLKYIFDRTKQRPHISLVRIVGDTSQSQLLEQAVTIAQEYYRKEKIIII